MPQIPAPVFKLSNQFRWPSGASLYRRGRRPILCAGGGLNAVIERVKLGFCGDYRGEPGHKREGATTFGGGDIECASRGTPQFEKFEHLRALAGRCHRDGRRGREAEWYVEYYIFTTPQTPPRVSSVHATCSRRARLSVEHQSRPKPARSIDSNDVMTTYHRSCSDPKTLSCQVFFCINPGSIYRGTKENRLNLEWNMASHSRNASCQAKKDC